MGPSAIRYAGLNDDLLKLGHRVTDWGNLPVPVPESRDTKNPRLKYSQEIVGVARSLAQKVEEMVLGSSFPVILGGDHAVALGTVAGLMRTTPRLGVLWFDAHGDFNTDQTSPSGNVHGMPVAAMAGYGHPELTELFAPHFIDLSRVVYIGVRTLDAEEARLLRDTAATVFSMHDIDRWGMQAVIERALDIFAGAGAEAVHVSFDIDAVDPLYAPGSGTPCSGGLTEREAHLALELLAESSMIRSCEMVEVNPILDEHNRTGMLAAALLASLMGRRII